jgi:hypothetical protein
VSRLCLVVVLLILSVPALAQEQDAAIRASARALGEEGNALYAQGDFAGALDRYERAASLVDVPTIHVRAARSLAKLGRLVDAAERYRSVVRKGVAADALEVHRDAVHQAQNELAALEPTIPWVIVEVPGFGAGDEVTLDDVRVAAALVGVRRAIDPGDHVARVKRGDRLKEVPFRIEPGETKKVTVSLDDAAVVPPPPPDLPPDPPPVVPPTDGEGGGSAQVPIGWTFVGVGAAGLVAGLALVGVTASKNGDLTDRCGEALDCLPPDHADADTYNTMRVATTGVLIAGGVLAALGVVLVVTAPDGSEVAITPMAARGRF